MKTSPLFPGKLQILIMSGEVPTHTAITETGGVAKLDLAYNNFGARVIVNISRKQIAHCSANIEQLTGYTQAFVMRTGLQKLFQIIHPKDRFDYQLYLHRFCKNIDKKVYKQYIGKRFRIMLNNGSYLELLQLTEVFNYEGQGMLLIHIKKHYPKLNSAAKQKTSVSNRELQVLRLLGSGFSSKEIADKLCISNHTAVSHRKNLIEKFRVRNTAHLIREASKLLEM